MAEVMFSIVKSALYKASQTGAAWWLVKSEQALSNVLRLILALKSRSNAKLSTFTMIPVGFKWR